MQEYSNCHRTGNGKKHTETKPSDPSLISPKTDPQGMYTGVPLDPDKKPIQDADDL